MTDNKMLMLNVWEKVSNVRCLNISMDLGLCVVEAWIGVDKWFIFIGSSYRSKLYYTSAICFQY